MVARRHRPRDRHVRTYARTARAAPPQLGRWRGVAPLTAHAQLIAHAHARMYVYVCSCARLDVIVAGILKIISVPALALYSCVFVYNSFSSLVRVGDGVLIIQDHVCCPFSK